VVQDEPELVLTPVRHRHVEAGEAQRLETDVQQDLGQGPGFGSGPHALEGAQQEIPILVQMPHQFLGAVQAGLEGPGFGLEVPQAFFALG
jgi:hypothetical protein